MACTGSRHGINGKLRGRPTMDWAPSNARLSRTQWTCKWRLNLLPQSKKVPNSETLWLSLALCAFVFFEIFPKLREHNAIVIPQSIAPRCSPNWKRICPSRSPFTWKAPWHMTRRFWWPIRKPNAKRSTILSWMDHPRNRLWVIRFYRLLNWNNHWKYILIFIYITQVILSSKMTLSLINLDANQQNGNENKQEIESPLADDIEIIGHDEQ